MTAQIIPFPPRQPEPDLMRFLYLNSTGVSVAESYCSDGYHFFTSKDTPCQCGQERWPRPLA